MRRIKRIVRYQAGNLERRKRLNGPDVWVYRYRERSADGATARRGITLGTARQMTRSQALGAIDELRREVNRELPGNLHTFGEVIDAFLADETQTRNSTRTFYMPWIRNHIRPKWGACNVRDVKAYPVEKWLNALPLGKKSKQHIRSLMKLTINYAMKREVIPMGQNPMSLVRVWSREDETSVEKRVLTAGEFRTIIQLIPEPYRTMCMVGCCLGLRVSEILGLQWGDVDFEKLYVTIQRAVVLGTVGRVKTKKSAARMPLDAELATVLLDYKLRTDPNASATDWLFSNPETNRPWRPSHIQSKYIRPAGIKVVGTTIGWHNFRHTFSTMLRANGADIKVQQELVRHADAATTLNIYTQADSELKRKAVGQVATALLDTSGHFQE